MISPARRRAFHILRRVAAHNARASDLLASRCDRLSERDRRLAYELVLGVLRWHALLDHLIAHYSRWRPEKLDEPVRIALHLGLYQLRFLKRIPPYAAVSEAVALVKQYGPPWGAGFVNAILRRAASCPEDRPWEKIGDPIERAHIELSHPRWLVEKWMSDFGREEALALMRANNQAPPVVVRFNTLVASEREIAEALEREGIAVKPSPVVPGAYRVLSGSISPHADVVTRGWVYIQDEASQLVSHLVAPKPGMRVLEICAAPGGKTTHMAALMSNSGMIVAGDRHWRRLRVLRDVAARLRVRIAHPIVFEGRGPLPFSGVAFERVVVDVPCSGTGTLRRNPEIKWRLTPDLLRSFVAQQKALLAEAAQWVATGGWLIYSTCSLEREENEEVIEDFLAGHGAFEVVPPEVAEEVKTEGGYVRTFPHRQEMDGFFVAILKRKNFARAP